MESKKSFKKFYFMLATWLVVVIAVIGGSLLYDQYKTSEYDQKAEIYINQVMPEISKWDSATTKALMAKEVAATISDEKFAQAMILFSRLGSLQSINKPKLIEVHTGEQGDIGTQTIIEYDIDAEYTTGNATINLKLLFRDDRFEIYNFNFSSAALLE